MLRPTRSSRSTASAARIIRFGTRSTAIRRNLRRRSFLAPRARGKRRCDCRSIGTLMRYSEEHPKARVFVIRYDDFNPFLDHFCERTESTNQQETGEGPRCLAVVGPHGFDSVPGRHRLGRPNAAREREGHASRSGQRASRCKISIARRPATCCCSRPVTTNPPRRPSRVAGIKLRKRLHYGNLARRTEWRFSRSSPRLLRWHWSRGCSLRGCGGAMPEGGPTSPHMLWLIPMITLIGAVALSDPRRLKNQFAAMGIRRHMRVGKRETSSLRKRPAEVPGEGTGQPAAAALRPHGRSLRTAQQVPVDSAATRISPAWWCLMDRVDEPHMTGGKAGIDAAVRVAAAGQQTVEASGHRFQDHVAPGAASRHRTRDA